MPHITLEVRYQIAHDIRAGIPNIRIALLTAIKPRRLDREIARCGGRSYYDAEAAQAHRHACGQRSAANHVMIDCLEWQKIEGKVASRHSPEQARASASCAMSLSTIYRYLHRLKKKSLLKQLRHPQKRGPVSRGNMVQRGVAKSIHDRPVKHMNKLIRQYIPKGISLKGYARAMLNKIADELNDQVRKRLGWKSPKQLLFEVTTAPSI